MTRRVKLTLGGIGFFGTSGALYPTFGSNLRSLGALRNLTRVRGIPLISELTEETKTHKLQLDSSARKNNSQASFSVESVKLPEKTLVLKDKFPLSPEITFQGNEIEKEKITSSIKNVQTEINKESPLTDIYAQVSSEFETLSNKHFESDTQKRAEHLKNLKKVQLKVQDWQNAEPAKVLSQAQRDSLQKIYELHQELSNKKNSLNSQLEKIKTSDESGVGGSEQESQAPANPIKEALEEIGWSQEKIKFQKDSENADPSQTNDWGEWEHNPYKNFYEKENDYKTALNGNLEKPRDPRLSENSQSQIEFQVASKLLSLISPPSIESYPKELLDSLRKEESTETVTAPEEGKDVTVEETEQVEESEEVGNCAIDSSMTHILQSQGQSEQDYYSVSCANEETDRNYEITFGKRWGGAFPKTLLKLKNPSKLRKLDIKVKIDYEKDVQDEEYEFGIEFWGQQFDSKITGEFKYEGELSDSNNTGAVVKLTNPNTEKNIYLLTDLDNET